MKLLTYKEKNNSTMKFGFKVENKVIDIRSAAKWINSNKKIDQFLLIPKTLKESLIDWDKNFSYKEYTPLTISKGRKFMKLIDETSVWGFVSMVDGEHDGVPVKKGDLMKPASWSKPAKHSRGNIFEGTAKYTYYGPEYLQNYMTIKEYRKWINSLPKELDEKVAALHLPALGAELTVLSQE